MSNRFVLFKTKVLRMRTGQSILSMYIKRNGHLLNTRNTNLLPQIFIVLAIEAPIYNPIRGSLRPYFF